MPFLLTLALTFLLGAFTHFHIPSLTSFIPKLAFLLQISTSPAPCLQFVHPTWSPVNSLCRERHILGGRDGKETENPLPSSKQPSDEVPAVREEMSSSTGTFVGCCRTSQMIQKRPEVWTWVQRLGDGDRTGDRYTCHIGQGPSSRQGWR